MDVYGDEDRRFMRKALSLAAKGKGMTHPNPMVGAVVVKDGKIAGTGFHRGPFTAHAEVEAMGEAGTDAVGATLYVTLEPCNHRGRTPPCTDAIVGAGIARVIVAAEDPNPYVRGGGNERLKREGLLVETGLLSAEASRLNEAYEKLVVTGMPFVTLKVAATADGRVAARGGNSRWITGEPARKKVHYMRRESDAVLVGKGTVEADDPELTVRMVPMRGARPPLRVVVDSRLTASPGSRLAQGGDPKVIMATTIHHDRGKAAVLRERGVEVLVVGDSGGRVNLSEVISKLGERGVARLLVEGGPTLAASFMEEGLADRLVLFLAPRAFGDERARSWMEGRVVEEPSQGLPLTWKGARRVGEDLLLEADLGGYG